MDLHGFGWLECLFKEYLESRLQPAAKSAAGLQPAEAGLQPDTTDFHLDFHGFVWILKYFA